uniref:DDE-1 domain-containing protein n=1 Tax=Chelonoidis abingdonii TaxID=106734 RepID=A0A8C0H4T4_CHEAB
PGKRGKRQRSYTGEEKLAATDRVNSGETQVKVSKDIGIAKSTLRRWLKGMRLSGPILQAQATIFGNLTGDESFQASKGGAFLFFCLGRRSADESPVNVFPAELKSILQNKDDHEGQLYNCDATALFAKLLPDKTLVFNYETQKTAGFKKIKDRVTLLFCSHKTGSHKITPLLTGHFHNPRCFNHLSRAKLPVIYANSKNAWMTRHIFDDWLHNSFVPAVRKHLRSKKLEAKALLLLDNCPGHPPTESLVSRDGKIRVLYLPFKKTSKIQPLDQGIIQNFKNNYRRDLILVIVSCTSSGISELLKQLNMKGIIYLVKKTWDRVKQKSIENCWMKALRDIKEDKGKLLFQMIKFFRLDTLPEIIMEWLEMDEDCPTSGFLSKEEILTGCETTLDSKSDGENSNDAGLNDNDVDVCKWVCTVLRNAQISGPRWGDKAAWLSQLCAALAMGIPTGKPLRVCWLGSISYLVAPPRLML